MKNRHRGHGDYVKNDYVKNILGSQKNDKKCLRLRGMQLKYKD